MTTSVTGKLMLVLAIFLAVPAILFQQFRAADLERGRLILSGIQEQGRLVAEALRPALVEFTGSNPVQVRDRLVDLVSEGFRVRLLLRANGENTGSGFFLIAAQPPVSAEFIERDLLELQQTGVLGTISGTCEAEEPAALRYRNPAGEEEVLASIAPVRTEAGCWAVVLSQTSDSFLGSSIARSYWQTPEVRIAAISYVVMAVAAGAVFLAIWNSLRRFAQHARQLRYRRLSESSSFVATNTVPEMHGVAEEFDHLVDLLHTTAESVRISAQEKTHAMKGPLATIAQSVEPLRRRVTGDRQGTAACDRIEAAIERMNGLLMASQRINQAIAESMEPANEPIPLSEMLANMVESYDQSFEARGLTLERQIAPGLRVIANEDTIETIVDNLLENARSFSPEGGRVFLGLSRNAQSAEILVEDSGPGVAADVLPHIFDRYYSSRPEPGNPASEPHFGIGLWLVRRNATALGGDITAENRPEGGFRVTVLLPLVS
ncbi:MAG: ATP-binding protein [Acetobacterales bacterium]